MSYCCCSVFAACICTLTPAWSFRGNSTSISPLRRGRGKALRSQFQRVAFLWIKVWQLRCTFLVRLYCFDLWQRCPDYYVWGRSEAHHCAAEIYYCFLPHPRRSDVTVHAFVMQMSNVDSSGCGRIRRGIIKSQCVRFGSNGFINYSNQQICGCDIKLCYYPTSFFAFIQSCQTWFARSHRLFWSILLRSVNTPFKSVWLFAQEAEQPWEFQSTLHQETIITGNNLTTNREE